MAANSELGDHWNWSDHVDIGDVVLIQEAEYRTLGVPQGEYVVESAQNCGGWTITARKLDSEGKYISDNLLIQFRQCPGYIDSLCGNYILVIGHMKRVFV